MTDNPTWRKSGCSKPDEWIVWLVRIEIFGIYKVRIFENFGTFYQKTFENFGIFCSFPLLIGIL